MKKCKCRLPHNQAEIYVKVTHKPPKGQCETFNFHLNKSVPKDRGKTVVDYPGLFKRIQKVDKAVKLPWHLKTEMTTWEFVPKKRPVIKQPKYSANSLVPHSYYEYTSNVFNDMNEAKIVETT